MANNNKPQELIQTEFNELSLSINKAIEEMTLRTAIRINIDSIEKFKEYGFTYSEIFNKLNLKKNNKPISLIHFRDLIYFAKRNEKNESKIIKKQIIKEPNKEVLESNVVVENKNDGLKDDKNDDPIYDQWNELFPFLTDRLINELIEFGLTNEDGQRWIDDGHYFSEVSQVRAKLNSLKNNKTQSLISKQK